MNLLKFIKSYIMKERSITINNFFASLSLIFIFKKKYWLTLYAETKGNYQKFVKQKRIL